MSLSPVWEFPRKVPISMLESLLEMKGVEIAVDKCDDEVLYQKECSQESKICEHTFILLCGTGAITFNIKTKQKSYEEVDD